MRVKNLNLAAITIASAVITIGASTAWAQENKPPVAAPVAVTQTTTPRSSPVSGAPSLDFAAAEYSKTYGVDEITARRALESQQVVVLQAMKLRAKSPALIGGIALEHSSGEIGVRVAYLGNPADVTTAFPSAKETVTKARWNEQQIADNLGKLNDDAKTSLGADYTAVGYDVFTDSLTVKVRPSSGRTKTVDVSKVLPSLASLAPGLDKSSAVVEEAVPQPVHGGQSIFVRRTDGVISNSHICTTGFGTWRSGSWGYITAGHCTQPGDPVAGGTSWGYRIEGINTNAVTPGTRAIGGYRDSQIVTGAAPSWFTFTGASDVDMSSTIGHIFQNTFYCKYGRSSGQGCGTIDLVNQLTALNVWATRAPQTNNVPCQTGDSGGPVWLPGADPIPSGLAHATNPPNFCYFVSLDDQMGPIGAVLL